MSDPLTTIVLHFEGNGENVTYDCRYESDEVLNTETGDDGQPQEKTSFAPGDPYYFLIYCTGNAEVTRVVPAAGSVTGRGSVSRTREDVVLFPEINQEEEKPTLSYNPTGGLSQDWKTDIIPTFNVGTGLRIDSGDRSLHITGGAVPCQAYLTYGVRFTSWLFTPPAMNLPEGESIDIPIVIYLREINT